jgi:hypothetical protein
LAVTTVASYLCAYAVLAVQLLSGAMAVCFSCDRLKGFAPVMFGPSLAFAALAAAFIAAGRSTEVALGPSSAMLASPNQELASGDLATFRSFLEVCSAHLGVRFAGIAGTALGFAFENIVDHALAARHSCRRLGAYAGAGVVAHTIGHGANSPLEKTIGSTK